jgi:hypothetical protein
MADAFVRQTYMALVICRSAARRACFILLVGHLMLPDAGWFNAAAAALAAAAATVEWADAAITG